MAGRRGGGVGEQSGASPGEGPDSKGATGGGGQQQEPGRKHPGRRGLASFLAGALSGTLMGATLQPFDVIRTYMQAQALPAASRGASTSASATAAALSAPAAGTAATAAGAGAGAGAGLSMVGAARQVVAQHGVKGLWRGVGPTCVRIGLGAGIYFATLDAALQAARGVPLLNRSAAPTAGPRPTRGTPQPAAQSSSQDLAPAATFFAGMASRSLAVVLLNPVTVVKTRMEVWM